MKFTITIEDTQDEEGDSVQLLMKTDEKFNPRTNPEDVTPAAIIMMYMMNAGHKKLDEMCGEVTVDQVDKFN